MVNGALKVVVSKVFVAVFFYREWKVESGEWKMESGELYP
jgi:hypothetical protein